MEGCVHFKILYVIRIYVADSRYVSVIIMCSL